MLKSRLVKTSLKTLLVGVLNVHWNDRGMPVMTAMLQASVRKKRLGCRVLRRLRMRRWLMADMFQHVELNVSLMSNSSQTQKPLMLENLGNDLWRLVTPCWTVLVFVLLMIVA